MNTHPKPLSTRPGFVITLVVSWLTVRGLLWIAEALFFQEPNLSWHASLVDGLLGIFCISLAIQLWIGISGVLLPVVIMLAMHFGIHIYRWAIIDPHSWWTISTLQRLQVVFESGISLLLIHLLIFFPRPKALPVSQK